MIRTAPQTLRSRPSVSVVIPCYKYGHFLPDCVSSVLDQDGVDVDVTIVDDASPDDSLAVAHRLAAAEPRVRVIAHETNQGHIATYNEGLAAATGEYCVLLSADDLLAPQALANSTGLLNAYPEVGLVYGFTRPFTDTPPSARTQVRSWSVWSGPEWLDLVCRRVSNPIYTPEVVMRTKTMQDLAGYDARLPHAADFLLWLRAATRGSVGRVNDVDLAFYRVHGQNMHQAQYPGALRDLSERNRCFEVLFADDGDRMPNGGRLKALAQRGMAREALIVACRAYQRPVRPTPDEADILAQLVILSEEVWPASRDSRLRHAYQRLVTRADNGKGPFVPPATTALRDKVVTHLGWRRWRRTGVSPAVRGL